jgi:RNA polymerase sigma-70 factor (ECF subfamily)
MPTPPPGPPAFVATRWSLVARAVGPDLPQARAALEDLCRGAWYPLYAFLRRRGHSAEDAEDLVQGFFARLLEKGWLAQADPSRGRLRTFLVTALLHHAGHERERAGAIKRGGDRTHVALDRMEGERLYALEPATNETPEALYERRFAQGTLARALARVATWARAGPDERQARYEALLPLLWDEGTPQAEVAARLGSSETAVRVALHRLRARLKDELRREVLDTLEDPADLDDELRRLAAALRAG